MLRKEILRATSNVLAALEETGFVLLFESLLPGKEKDKKDKLLPAFSHYIKLYEQFGDTEKMLLSILDLDRLHNTDFWTNLMTVEGNKMLNEIIDTFQAIQFAQEHLPKILKLIERESDTKAADNKKSEANASADELGQLCVTVIEDRDKSTPERLVLVLQSIDGLYRACAFLAGEQETGLSVESCDSGSDKAFDFLGAAKIVESVKEIILSFWDRVVYFREDKTGRRLELVAQSLPILDQIGAMKEAGKLEPERAELLKRQIVDSVTKFGKAGATIPEIDRATFHNPRQLMKPEPKLLVEPKYPQSEHLREKKTEDDTPSQIADPEFEKYMETMAKKFLKSRGQSCNDNNNPDGMP
ncbi:MAG: hypothetical protein CDV28_101186 [Candidatus Electronema aureum]|uniref:Uncharacterized protein n=1 Tax=Candidatus Electronema aureum TaxID=2005002 RepID=A0A521G5K4_9BACT|nr:MAG: hypothetical protein CDV28_101186 [Candidatus Electronema aureum]